MQDDADSSVGTISYYASGSSEGDAVTACVPTEQRSGTKAELEDIVGYTDDDNRDRGDHRGDVTLIGVKNSIYGDMFSLLVNSRQVFMKDLPRGRQQLANAFEGVVASMLLRDQGTRQMNESDTRMTGTSIYQRSTVIQSPKGSLMSSVSPFFNEAEFEEVLPRSRGIVALAPTSITAAAPASDSSTLLKVVSDQLQRLTETINEKLEVLINAAEEQTQLLRRINGMQSNHIFK